jgi:uncharacterized protein (DUF2062 family)
MLNWAKRKVLGTITSGLKNGISPKKIAVTLSLAIVVGIIPLYGVTTVLIALLAIGMRLNIVLMQAVHYLVHPVQIALIIPFFKAGDIFVRNSEVQFTVRQYIELFKTDFWNGLEQLWLLNLSAVGIWLILSIPLYYLLYSLFFNNIRRYAIRIRKTKQTA